MESYKPKNDPDRTAWLLRADGFDFCDKKTNADGTSATVEEQLEPMQDDDIPF